MIKLKFFSENHLATKRACSGMKYPEYRERNGKKSEKHESTDPAIQIRNNNASPLPSLFSFIKKQ